MRTMPLPLHCRIDVLTLAYGLTLTHAHARGSAPVAIPFQARG